MAYRIPESPYYPPRANRFSRISCFLNKLRFVHKAVEYSYEHKSILFKVLIPGLSFKEVNPIIYRIILIIYCASLVGFILLLGTGWSATAFSIMVFLHSISIVNCFGWLLRQISLKIKVGFAIFISVILTMFCFSFIQMLDRTFLFPLRYKDSNNWYVVLSITDFKKIKPGDKIAYYRDRLRVGPAVYIEKGRYIGTVIAKGGSKIEFKGKLIKAEDRIYATSKPILNIKEFVVPKNDLFVLPDEEYFEPGIFKVIDFDIRFFLINENDYRGYLPKKWFCKRQYY